MLAALRSPSRMLLAPMLALTACLGAANHSKQSAPSFDGDRALEHVRKLVAIGPRPAGSAGAKQAREYIAAELQAAGWEVDEQGFEAQTPLGPSRMVNVRATLRGTPAGERLIVAGHYDTKLFQQFSFVGANDGGSSTAFLLELARVLPALKADARTAARYRIPIELLFLDGEEAVVEWRATDHTYGSRHYVRAARAAGDLKNIRALILVDMIGDRDLRILRESRSTRWLTEIIWSTARSLGRAEFEDDATPVEDDHLEFLAAGVPAVDIIDMDYPAWHTAEDTVDKVAAPSLKAVGDVVLAALPDIERRLSGPR